MVEAVVEYDYDAVNPDELNLKEGQTITNINMLEEGWWEGELNGKRGMFPDNFVKVIKEDTSNKRNSKSRAPGPPPPPVNGNTNISQESDVVKRESSASKRKFRAKVAFSYHPENEDELNLEVDDIIEVTGQPEDGWWEGMLRGHKGVFPSNFVTLMEGDEGTDVANGKVDKPESLSPPEGDTKGGIIVPRPSMRRSRHVGSLPRQQEPPPVKPTRPLSLRQGSVELRTAPLEPKDDPIKEEEAPAQKQPKPIGGKPVGGVGFGNIFAGGSVHLRKTNQDSKGPKKAEPPKRPELSNLAQKRQSLKKPLVDDANKRDSKKDLKEIKAEKKEEPKEEMAPEEETVGKTVNHHKPPVKPTTEAPVIEKAKVNFDYDAQNPDELSLKEGVIVVVLSKEAGDSGWWEGEYAGKRGVFPDNFVTLLPPERIKRKVPAAVPARPNAAPKTNDEVKPVTAHKPRRGSKEPPPKPPVPESEAPKEPVKEDSKPHLPPGAKQIFPMVPPKKPNLKKLPPKPQDKDLPKRPSSFVDRDQNKEKPVPEKKDIPLENKPEKVDGTFDDIKPSTEKLKHVNLSRPRNANKRPPSVFGAVPGVTVNDGASKHVPGASSSQPTDQQVPVRNVMHKFTPSTHASDSSSTNTNPPTSSPSSQPPWAKDKDSPPSQPPWAKDLKRTSGRRPTPLALATEQMDAADDEPKTAPPRRRKSKHHSRNSNTIAEQENESSVAFSRRPAHIWKPVENDINSSSGPPPRPNTTPSPTAPHSAAKPDTSPVSTPGHDQPQPEGASSEQTATLLESMEDMKKQMKSMQDDMNKQLASMKTEFKRELKKLMVEVDEEKKLRLSMQVELERVKKLVLDS